MKSISFQIVLILIQVISLVSSMALAGELETEVAKAATSEYVKEQIKYRLADFLNKHPEVVGSTSASIGTQSMKFLGQSLALYGLVNAKTDKEKMWSASHLLLSPEPTTALVLVAVQLADTYASLKAQAALAAIYAETAALRAEALKITRQVYTHEANSQMRLLVEYNTNIDAILALRNSMLNHPVNRFFQVDGSEPPPSAKQIEDALMKSRSMEQKLNLLETQIILIEGLLRPEILELTNMAIADIRALNRSFDPVRLQNTALLESVQYYFASLKRNQLVQQIRKDLSPHATHLRIYKKCTHIINTTITAEFWHLASHETSLNELLEDCHRRFEFMKVNL